MKKSTSFFSIYGVSAVVTAVLVVGVGLLAGLDALATMCLLIMLEVTFSLDNAVVNATVLRHMSPFWQRMFVTVGIIIAVFGMRMLFPLVLVAITTGLDLPHVVTLALEHPGDYSARLAAAQPTIAAFGGMFLLMVFLHYICGGEQMQPHTSRPLKRVILRVAEMVAATAVLASVVVFAPEPLRLTVAVAGLIGVAVYLVVGTFTAVFMAHHQRHKGLLKLPWHAGLISFLYLELLDASFSFDSVIGAFAITTNALLIVAGLGVGALWVRSITIYLVRRGTLATYPYLDAGAHYAIAALAGFLLLSIRFSLPEVLTGGAGLLIILVSFVASVVKNRAAGRRRPRRRAVKSAV